jgi:hypothetical protein
MSGGLFRMIATAFSTFFLIPLFFPSPFGIPLSAATLVQPGLVFALMVCVVIWNLDALLRSGIGREKLRIGIIDGDGTLRRGWLAWGLPLARSNINGTGLCFRFPRLYSAYFFGCLFQIRGAIPLSHLPPLSYDDWQSETGGNSVFYDIYLFFFFFFLVCYIFLCILISPLCDYDTTAGPLADNPGEIDPIASRIR